MNRPDWTIYPRFPVRNVMFLAMKLLKYKTISNGIEGGFYKDGTIYWFGNDGRIHVMVADSRI